MYHKHFYKKYQKKNLVQALDDLNVSSDDIADSDALSEEEEKAAMLFFRTCVVHRDREQLKIKLKQTVKARENLIRKKGTKFHQVFPFYFIDPMLVCYFFINNVFKMYI